MSPAIKEEKNFFSIEKIREYAEQQMISGNYDGVSFEYGGQSIFDPWKDSSARFDLSTEEAFIHYGTDNMLRFIEGASETIGVNAGPFPTEGILIVSLTGELGSRVEIWKHGSDDYAAYFIDEDCSVRGLAADIADEVECFLIRQKKQYCINRIRDMSDHAFDELYAGLKKILA